MIITITNNIISYFYYLKTYTLCSKILTHQLHVLFHQQRTLNRRKGRMRSESAAAIAVLRSASGAVIAADDTQFLLSNDFSNVDTEVVFNHRTVL